MVRLVWEELVPMKTRLDPITLGNVLQHVLSKSTIKSIINHQSSLQTKLLLRKQLLHTSNSPTTSLPWYFNCLQSPHVWASVAKSMMMIKLLMPQDWTYTRVLMCMRLFSFGHVHPCNVRQQLLVNHPKAKLALNRSTLGRWRRQTTWLAEVVV